MSAFCLAHGVRLLAYGTLAGGFLTRALARRARARPTSPTGASPSTSASSTPIGGWAVLQSGALGPDRIARKHGVSVANVATRWVLEQPAVAAVIVHSEAPN